MFEQFVYFPSSLRLIYHCIISEADILDNIIVKYEIKISDISPVKIKYNSQVHNIIQFN